MTEEEAKTKACFKAATFAAPAEARSDKPLEPVAWRYEIASHRHEDGSYHGWSTTLAFAPPRCPEGSTRNLTPLYTANCRAAISKAEQP